MKEIRIECLDRLFTYLGGNLYWNERPEADFKNKRAFKIWHTRYLGREAGTVSLTTGYMYVNLKLNGRVCKLAAHRVVYAMHKRYWPKGEIDHINHERVDNRIENLREVSRQENRKNQSLLITNKSGVSGVYWSKVARKWIARISLSGKYKHLGCFTSLEDAKNCVELARKNENYHKNHGE